MTKRQKVFYKNDANDWTLLGWTDADQPLTGEPIKIDSVAGGQSMEIDLSTIPNSPVLRKRIKDIAEGGDGCSKCEKKKEQLLGPLWTSYIAGSLSIWLGDYHYSDGKSDAALSSWSAKYMKPTTVEKPAHKPMPDNYKWHVADDHDFYIPEGHQYSYHHAAPAKPSYEELLAASKITYYGNELTFGITTADETSHYARAHALIRMVPDLMHRIVQCPADQHPESTDRCTRRNTIYDIVIHLNDIHRWDRATQIADWLDTLDADLTIPMPYSTTEENDNADDNHASA